MSNYFAIHLLVVLHNHYSKDASCIKGQVASRNYMHGVKTKKYAIYHYLPIYFS